MSYFYKPKQIFVVLLVFFFLLAVIAGRITDGTYLIGALLFAGIITFFLSLLVGLIKKAGSAVDAALPPAPQATAPKSAFFQAYGVFTEIVGVLLIIFGFFAGTLFAALGGGKGGVYWIALFASGGVAMITYGHGIRKQHNWVIPFWIVFTLGSIIKNITSLVSNSSIPQSELLQGPAMYATGFGGFLFSIFVVYKLYEHRNAFSGRYFSIGSVIFLICISITGYVYFTVFHGLL